MLAIDDDYYFLDVGDALRYAYKFSNKDQVRIAAIQKSSNGSNKDDLSSYDRIAQSALILASLKHLSTYGRYAIELHYSPIEGVTNMLSKWFGNRISREHGYDRKFSIDCCNQFSNHTPYDNLNRYAKRLNKDKSTIWRNRLKIINYVDGFDKIAEADLKRIFIERGFIEG